MTQLCLISLISFTKSMVSFSGEIVERTLCESIIGKKQIADSSVQPLKGENLEATEADSLMGIVFGRGS